MKDSIQILTTANSDYFSDTKERSETETNREKIKAHLGLIYFAALFASLILLFT
jgi:hypothetical protein